MAVQIGELRARLVAEANQMKQEIRSVKKEFEELGKQGQKTSAGIKQIDSALDRFGDSASDVGKLTAQLDNINARIDIQRKKLAELRQAYNNTFNDAQKMKIQEEILRTEASIMRLMKQSDDTAAKIWKLEDSLEDAADGLQDLKNQSAGAADGLDEVDESARRSSDSLRGLETVLTAIGSAIAVSKLVDLTRTTANEAAKLHDSLVGLDSVATAFGHNAEKARESAVSLAEDGLAVVSNYSAALKDVLSTGLGLEEANHLLEVFKDRAAFGKAETISFGQAIQNLGQAFKTESSTLGDMSGMTENFSQILEVGAQQLGKTVNELTQAERAYAKYLGIVQLSQPFIGDAAKLTEQYSGTQASLNARWQEAQEALGEAYIPLLDEIMRKVTPLIMDFTNWARENKEVVAGMTSATFAMSTMIGVVTALAFAFRTLQAATGWIGITLTLLGSLVGGVMAYNAAVEAVTDSVWKFAQSQEELNRKLEESPLNRTAQDVRNLEHDIEKINELMERRSELLDEIGRRQTEINEKAARGEYDISGGMNLGKLQKELNEINKSLSQLGIDTPDKAPEVLAELNRQLEGAIPAMMELERAELNELATKVEHIDRLSQLRDRYDDLSKAQELDIGQKAELASVVEQLKREYPGLEVHLEAEGNWYINNRQLLDELIDAERRSVDAAAEASRQRLEAWRVETEAKLKLAKEQVKVLGNLAEVDLTETKFGQWLPGQVAEGFDFIGDLILKGLQVKAQDNVNKYQQLLLEIDRDLQRITTGAFDEFRRRPVDFSVNVRAPEDVSKKVVQTAEDLRRQAFQADMATMRFRAEMYDWTAQQQIAALEEIREKHKKHLADTIEDERAVLLQIKRLNDEITRDKTRQEETMYKLEQSLADQRIKLYESVKRERERDLRELTNRTLDAIRRMRDAELESIDEQKRAINDLYRERIQALDEQDYAEERKKIVDEMEKYRYAASKRGQDRFRELQEQLQRLDDQKLRKDLQNERDEKLRALDEQKRDLEKHFNELRDMFTGSSEDILQIEQLLQDNRIESFRETNEQMLNELRSYVAEYNRIMNTTTEADEKYILDQMQLNSIRWHFASAAEKRALELENERLGASIGANKEGGVWYRDGRRLFHTGGMDGLNFRYADTLMPDEIAAIIKRTEFVLQPKQLATLLEHKTGTEGGDINYHGPLVEVREMHVRDEQDIVLISRDIYNMSQHHSRGKGRK